MPEGLQRWAFFYVCMWSVRIPLRYHSCPLRRDRSDSIYPRETFKTPCKNLCLAVD